MKDIIEMARTMRELQKRKDDIEATLKEINADLDELRLKKIPDAMAEEDLRTLTIEGVGRVQLTRDAHVSLVDKKLAYEWLQEYGFGHLIQDYVQPATLKAFVKTEMQEGQEFPEELFKISQFVRASIVNI